MSGKGNLGWNPHKTLKRLERNCLKCGKNFYTWPSVNSIYCSYSCSNIANAITHPRPTPPQSKGNRHYNWKGGISSDDKKERLRFRSLLQKKVLSRDNYTCQVCDQYSGNLQVDHIKSWKDYPELRFELSNCRTLCMACHYYVTFKRKLPEGVIWGHNLSNRRII